MRYLIKSGSRLTDFNMEITFSRSTGDIFRCIDFYSLDPVDERICSISHLLSWVCRARLYTIVIRDISQSRGVNSLHSSRAQFHWFKLRVVWGNLNRCFPIDHQCLSFYHGFISLPGLGLTGYTSEWTDRWLEAPLRWPGIRHRFMIAYYHSHCPLLVLLSVICLVMIRSWVARGVSHLQVLRWRERNKGWVTYVRGYCLSATGQI